MFFNAEELDEPVEGLKLTKSINTPTSSPIEKNWIVQVLNTEELGELVKDWRLTKSINTSTSSPIVKKMDCAGFECGGAG